jgi:mRNA-degrading endonuclease YafQ of YafQ-DinJ toxin-antitoxin module
MAVISNHIQRVVVLFDEQRRPLSIRAQSHAAVTNLTGYESCHLANVVTRTVPSQM